MKRRCNFTGRKRIPHRLVRIRVSGVPRKIDATLTLEELELPGTGRIFVEVFSSGSPTVQRFAWGSVQSPRPPSDPRLTEITGDGLGCVVKVVDENVDRGKLLAVSAHIRPIAPGDDETGGSRQSLLPVNFEPLEAELWRLDFTHDRPWLMVNSDVPGLRETLKSDPRIFGLIFPQVLRQVFFRLLFVDESCDPDGPEDDWQVQWLRWGVEWHPDKEAPPEREADQETKTAWIEEVVATFCLRHDIASRAHDAFESGLAKR